MKRIFIQNMFLKKSKEGNHPQGVTISGSFRINAAEAAVEARGDWVVVKDALIADIGKAVRESSAFERPAAALARSLMKRMLPGWR